MAANCRTGQLGRLPAAGALLLALLSAAAAGVDAIKCGRNAGGKRCPNPKDCCSIYGFCGTGARFCAIGKCDSGACYGKPKPPPARPRGCAGVCGITVRQGATARPACRRGLVVVGIPTAVYGAVGKKCVAPKSRRVALRRCVGRPFCTIPATNAQFGGDPCPRVQRKTLWVRYVCKPGKPRPVPSPSPKPSPRPSPAPAPSDAYYSTLWGRNGEYWRPTSRLADYAWAGYKGNEGSVPTYPVRFDVKKYGAKGDGVADDTRAVQAALNAAGAAADLLNTYDCSTRYTRRRCQRPSDGWGNQGRAGVAVWLPPGQYRITQTLTIGSSNVVLRGAGQGKTRLFFPKGLQAVYGNKEVWGTSGGFIIIDGYNAGSNKDKNLLARITANVRKGDRRIQVSTTSGIKVGQWVRLYALASSPAGRRLQFATGPLDPAPPTAPAGTGKNATAAPPPAPGNNTGVLPLPPALARLVADGVQQAQSEQAGVSIAALPGTIDAFIYGENLVDSGSNAFSGSDHLRFPSRVTKVGKGYIEMERPVPWDLRTQWQPVVHAFSSRTQHSGVERLTIEFRHDIYPSHLNTYGYNAIVLSSVSNCWVRGVDIVNADNGIQVAQSDFVTVVNIRISVTARRSSPSTAPNNGHHALWVSKSGDVAFTNFAIQDQYMHDLSVDGFSERCVFARGRGINLNIDCHRGGPHSHLFSNLDHGFGARPFQSGGDSGRGAHSGANNTFWNLYASRPVMHLLNLPDCDFGPLLNFVGVYNAPSGSSDSARRRGLLSNTTASGGRGSSAAPSNAKASTVSGSAGDSPSLAFSPAATSELSATSAGTVAAAGGIYPAWCPNTKWRTELVPQGKRLLPADLFGAMVATGAQRGVKRR